MRIASLVLMISFFAASSCAGQSPNAAEQYYSSGLAKADKGDFDGAIADYSKAIELNPRYPEAYAKRASAREAFAFKVKGNYNGVLDDYDKAIALGENTAELHNSRGYVRQLTGDLDGAIADFTNALELDGSCVVCCYNRATAFRNKGDLDSAMADFTKAIDAHNNPILSECYDGRGLVRGMKGDIAGAVEDFTKAISINPDNLKAYGNRGVALLRLRRDGEALKDFDHLLKVDQRLRPVIEETIRKTRAERAAKGRG